MGRPEDTLAAARAGDARAFETLARTEEGALYGHVARILGPGADAEDVVQDALLSAWRSIGSFNASGGASFRAWLFRIARNRAIAVIRARRRKGEVPLEPDPEEGGSDWAEPVEGGPDLLTIAAGREAFAAVELALASVPPEQRDALLLRDVEGFSYDEIALITGSAAGTVRSRIHRARLAVRNALVTRGWTGSAG
ncbi:MAG TPA: sigma-70 family RNA polymerase sigma factor [Candidatus Saccharimonadales bacterium]|nr:sigma-70 family RNA polymerase sigma factor [Candidatus Saccharimonadales bacterium]